MVCSKCGYVMGPFDKACPRCIPLAEAAPSPPTVQPIQTVNLISCPACQQMVSSQAIACPKCGQPISKNPIQIADPNQEARTELMGNGSGTGTTAVLPEELRGFNWGAFSLGGIWAINHNAWMGLLAFVPYLGYIMAIILGIRGNEWAWQNRHWESVEQFKQVQSAWEKPGIIYLWVATPLAMLFGIFCLAPYVSGGGALLFGVFLLALVIVIIRKVISNTRRNEAKRIK